MPNRFTAGLLLTMSLLPFLASAQTAPPTCSTTYTPSTFVINKPYAVDWSATNATSRSYTLYNAAGTAIFGPYTTGVSGHFEGPSFTDLAPGTYTRTDTVTGPGGTALCSAKLLVISEQQANAPTCSVTYTPATFTTGQPFAADWASTNATARSYTIYNSAGSPIFGPYSPAVSGHVEGASFDQFAPGTYTRIDTVTGAGGSGTCSKQLVVTAASVPAPACSVIYTPSTFTRGNPYAVDWASTNATSRSYMLYSAAGSPLFGPYTPPSLSGHIEGQSFTDLGIGSYIRRDTVTNSGGSATCELPFNVVSATDVPASCRFAGQKVLAGVAVAAYQTASVPAGQGCVQEIRTCNNGVLSGSYTNATCGVAGVGSCVLDGVTLSNGQPGTFYASRTMPRGYPCGDTAYTRTCTNGVLGGNTAAQYGSCADESYRVFNVAAAGYGAKGDGVTDDTAVVKRAAADAAAASRAGVQNVELYFPPTGAGYVLKDTIEITAPMTVRSDGVLSTMQPDTNGKLLPIRIVAAGAKIISALPAGHAPESLFLVESDNVTFNGFRIDARTTSQNLEGRQFAIKTDSSGLLVRKNLTIRHMQFTNLMYGYKYCENTNIYHSCPPTAHHALGILGVQGAVIEHNYFDAISGSPLFMADSSNINFSRNDVRNSQWSAINSIQNNHNLLFIGNRLSGIESPQGDLMIDGVERTLPFPYTHAWAAQIQFQGQYFAGGGASGVGDTGIIFNDNYITGNYHYSGILRISSANDVLVQGNYFDNIRNTNGYAVVVEARYAAPDTAHNNQTHGAAPYNVRIINNAFVAGGPFSAAIFAFNNDGSEFLGSLPKLQPLQDYAQDLLIQNNRILSADENKNFKIGINIHGYQGGWQRVTVRDNTITGANGSGYGIAVSSGSDERQVNNLRIENNQLSVVGSGANSSGVFLGRGVRDICITGNSTTGFGVPLQQAPGAAPYGLIENVYQQNCPSSVTGFAGTPLAQAIVRPQSLVANVLAAFESAFKVLIRLFSF